MAVVLLLAIVLTVSLRRPDTLIYPQLWAEDGPVFYASAASSGASSLLAPYAGYWHLYSRIVAYAGTFVPVASIPMLYAAGSLAALWLSLWCVWASRVFTSTSAYAAAVVLALCVPFSDEVYGVLTNAQWVLVPALLAAYGAPMTSNLVVTSLRCSGLILALFSGPFGLVLFPCALLAYWTRADGWSRFVCAMHAVSAGLTVYGLMAFPRDAASVNVMVRVSALWEVCVSRPLVAAAGAGAVLILATGTFVGVRRRAMALASIGLAGLLLIAATFMSGPANLISALPGVAGRYLFLPWICCAWTLLLLLSQGRRRFLWPLAAMCVVSLVEFRFEPLPRHDWPADAACLESRPFCDLVINPGWAIGLPGRGE